MKMGLSLTLSGITKTLILTTLLLFVGSSNAFVPQQHSKKHQLSSSSTIINNNNHHHRSLGLPSSSSSSNSVVNTNLLKIRGGGDLTTTSLLQLLTSSISSMSSIITTTLPSVLKNGPYGIIGLFGIASSVVVPLTMIRQGYSFSVGYGFSIMVMALAVSQTFGLDLTSFSTPISLLAAAVTFYGFRLGSFLLIREYTVESKRKQIKSFDKTSSLLQRLPLALSVSLFYAFMISPLLYAARYFFASSSSNNHSATLGDIGSIVFNVGVGLTWIGALCEAVADGQKFVVKKRNNKSSNNNNDDDESKSNKKLFVGPTGGLYKLCRHPNYLFEIVHWFGLTLAGIPTFGGANGNNKLAPYVYAFLGLYGIYSIMNGASKRLDKKQDESYGNQEYYQKYKSSVKGSLFPSLF